MTNVGTRYLVVDLQFAPMAQCPLCAEDLEIHEWLDMTGVMPTSPTSSSDQQTAEVVACDRVLCRWFARCDNYATHAEAHPVLGSVPACNRCPDIGRATGKEAK